MVCFDLSGLTPISESLKIEYRTAWGVYEKIQTNDVLASTLRKRGDFSKSYWIFESNAERNQWLKGLSLHTQRYPTSNWQPPQKN
jgi:hypothetical protein